MKKLLSLAIGIALVPVVAFSNVSALAAGQIEGGDIYRVKNVTKGGDFTDPATATCGDTVQFKVRIHNPGPDALTGVKVAATLPAAAATSHSSTVTVSATNANPGSTSDTAGLNLDKAGKLSYVAGSTELLDANNAKLQNLADGIVGGSVDVPNGVGVSTEQKRFVQFQAKVDCPTPPKECKPGIPVGDARCVDVPVTPTTPTTPQVLASTGPVETFAQIVGVTALAGAISYYIRSRRANILG